MDAGESFLVGGPALIAVGALVGAAFVVRSWRRTRVVLRDGERVPGQCVRIYTKVSGHGEDETSSRQHVVVEYTIVGSGTHRVDDATLPSTTCVGDQFTVAYDAQRPDKGVVVPPHGGTGGVGATIIVLILLVVAAGAAVGACSAAASLRSDAQTVIGAWGSDVRSSLVPGSGDPALATA
ncbi:DUF3592 domain-containing protein [Streptomyces sp. NPDC002574]|uniref:DUF3592 domain-containing protein n=1 Tax=Streptomyces sp. NPDC002574 TaxID=3364652 RepID=UPI0036C943E2